MIIKRNRAGQPTARPGGNNGAGDFFGQPQPHQPQEDQAPMWSEEALEAGLVNERRVNDHSKDRRRGYRRIEEKNLISKAYEEANAIMENAQREGYEQGMREAAEEVARLREEIGSLLSGREEALMSVADEIAGLAVEVAQRIIKTEVTCDDTLVMSLVRDTIQKAGRNNKTILIKLNPDDTATVKRALKEDPIPNMQAELIIMDDPAVDAGSCIIETNSGLIDASFSTQLGLLKQLFGSKDGGSRTEGFS